MDAKYFKAQATVVHAGSHIFESIDEASKQGYFEVTIQCESATKPKLVAALKDMGFVITEQGKFLNISWA